MQRRVVATLLAASIVLGASGCSTFKRAERNEVPTAAGAAQVQVQAPAPAPTAPTAPTQAPTTATTTLPPSTAPPTTVRPTAPATTTTSTSTTTTTIPMPAGIHDPACARVVQSGDSLSVIADTINDPTVTAQSLRAENGIDDVDVIHPGDVLDVCPGNEIDDLTGEQRGVPAMAVGSSGVAAQQQKLNELFAGYGLPPLAVDGVSGPFTRQQLCAARMALHLPISRADMVPGSEEEQLLMSAQSIAIPANAAIGSSRWIVINKTCQVMFAGEGGERVVFVFKTSTGEPDWETSNQESVRAFRYDPALDNDGWHNSTKFPAAEDNPLNGNMYRPLYFYRGQAIHGANNVPPEPASKGCARLRPENMDALLSWLGLDDITEPTYNRDRINLTVSVHGDYQPS
jgi:L,D-transpeptidase catalytic domain/LysM domain